MTKEVYIRKRFNARTKRILDTILKVIEDYASQGYQMTLRQLYYQLVKDNVIPNTTASYGKAKTIVKDARLAGLIDWEVIVDNSRHSSMEPEFRDMTDLIEVALKQYRRERWHDQPNYCEVWVEKDALASVLSPICKKFHVRLVVNRGYSSITFMYDAAQRFKYSDRPNILLYLGDHDPSGENMVASIRDTLYTFRAAVTVKKIALIKEQVDLYNLPPNKLKRKKDGSLADTRAVRYSIRHGDASWELDALQPNILAELLQRELLDVIDFQKYSAVMEIEEREKEQIRKFKSDYFSSANS